MLFYLMYVVFVLLLLYVLLDFASESLQSPKSY